MTKNKFVRVLASVMVIVTLIMLVACNETSGVSETTELNGESIKTETPKDIESKTDDLDSEWWSFDKTTGTLTVFCKGDMKDYAHLAPWHNEMSEITHIVIKDGVTSIAANAFNGCDNLVMVEIADDVTSIGEYAFSSCSKLTDINIPDNIMSVGNMAFYNCRNLPYSYFDEVKYLGNYDNPFLVAVSSERVTDHEVVLHADAKVVADYCFRHTKGSFTSVVIPDSVVSIGAHSFAYTELKNIQIGKGISYISGLAFDGCFPFEYNELDGVKYLGNSQDPYIVAVSAREGITKVVLPETVTYICCEAFSGCWQLESIILSENLLGIGENAFDHCTSLKKLNIPKNVRRIGNNAFSCANSLEEITVAAENDYYQSKGNCLIDTKNKILVLTCQNSTIPTDGSVTEIANWAFDRANEIDSIVLPDCVTKIGEESFETCEIVNFNELDGVKYIGSENNPYLYLYSVDESVTFLSIPDETQYIRSNAMYSCDNLEFIECGNGIEAIPNGLFQSCENLKEIKFNGALKYIGEDAFFYCENLETIEIPKSVTYIGAGAFVGCKNLKKVVLPSGIVKIEYKTFSQCESLSDIEIPEGVLIIGNEAFEDCENLTRVCIPKSMKKIGSLVFNGCDKLAEIEYFSSVWDWYGIVDHRNIDNLPSKPLILCTDYKLLDGEVVYDE